ncbi:hypothetical protein Defa_01480 [Desulfovibrio sp. TH_2024_36128]|uniref:Uncharacterized protein n=1 Tax=Desulfovibrio falkowii TaxID=3136602 RepID=A0ABQ0E4M5_9BACT
MAGRAGSGSNRSESARAGQKGQWLACMPDMGGMARKGGCKKNLCQWTGGDTDWRRPPVFQTVISGSQTLEQSTLKKLERPARIF